MRIARKGIFFHVSGLESSWYPSVMDYDRYRTIPNALKRYRQEQRLSQREVASLLGLKDVTWISHWENGRALPNLVSAIRPSVIYEAGIDELFRDLTKAIRGEKRSVEPIGPAPPAT